ncbi:hypothetical protein [Kitasatospora sp. NPDC056531]|uniref:hypothetical protein n=1 Tax=Kitasatospora sp. NPDC056531 TaxID=3345856 RepID=UPI0036B79AAF
MANMDPQSRSPEGSFARSLEQTPFGLKEGERRLKIQLAFNGSPKGHMSVYGNGWTSWSGVALVFAEWTDSDGKTYFRVTDGDWKDYYLSVNHNAYVGLYGWSNAVPWKFETVDGKNRLKCLWNHQLLSFYSDSNKYLYAWDDYNELEATPEWLNS